MAPVEGQPGYYSVVVHLPPGYHQYKFIVDGEWRHDETQPFMPDPLGNVNNWLFVRKPEGSAGATAAAGSATVGPARNVPPPTNQPLAGGGGTTIGTAPSSRTASPAPPMPHHQPQHPALIPSPIGGGGAPSPLSSVAEGEGGPSESDATMILTPPPSSPLAVAAIQLDPNEPAQSRKKIRDFLSSHTAYELIPESGKVVILDVDLPIRQAFHALHDQGGMATAPLWDSEQGMVIGMVSASDFILTLQQLRSFVLGGGTNPLSEREMDMVTVRVFREELLAGEGRPPKKLVWVVPTDNLMVVVDRLVDNHCSAVPVLAARQHALPGTTTTNNNNNNYYGEGGEGAPSKATTTITNSRAGTQTKGGRPEILPINKSADVLHIANLSGVLACLMRHVRSSPASLPLLAQPLGALPLGTWTSSSPITTATAGTQGDEGSNSRKVGALHVVRQATPLTDAMNMLLETGVSCLPVVDENDIPLDVWSRADVTLLARSSAYNRLQFEDVTVGQALSLASLPLPPPQLGAGGGGIGGGLGGHLHHHHLDSHGSGQWGRGNTPGASSSASSVHDIAHMATAPKQRLYLATNRDTLRTALERLSVQGVRRLLVVDPDSRVLEGIVSLSDVATYLFKTK